MATPNTEFFGNLLRVTGWDAQMTEYRDYDYDELDEAGTIFNGSNGSWGGQYPLHRYIKYTAFVETDSVFKANGIVDLPTLKEYIRQHAYYDENTSYGDDYTNPDNAVNQFVAYHLVKVGLDWSSMVTWSNEYGFSNGSKNDGSAFRVNVWEYWETMGKHRRTMKITGIRGNNKRINRRSVYNLASYREMSAASEEIGGIVVNQTNGS